MFGVLIKFRMRQPKQPPQDLIPTGSKSVSKFERTVREKIVCKTHLEWENYYFKHIFRILIKFPIQ